MNGARLTAVTLMAVAVAAGLGTVGYPAGSQGVPGPALLPRLLAAVLLVASAWLVAWPPSSAPPPMTSRRARAIAWTLVGLLVYVALWNVVPFVVRTALALLLFLRVLDVAWRPAVVTALVLAGAVFVVFERLLAVRL